MGMFSRDAELQYHLQAHTTTQINLRKKIVAIKNIFVIYIYLLEFYYWHALIIFFTSINSVPFMVLKYWWDYLLLMWKCYKNTQSTVVQEKAAAIEESVFLNHSLNFLAAFIALDLALDS